MSDQVKYSQKLSGDKVLIIGGSAGIGYGVAEACLENNCTVIISSSSNTRIASAISKLQAAYPSKQGQVSGHACNLGDERTLEANLEALFAKVGALDHIVHTAGDSLATIPVAEITLEKVKQAGLVRFYAPLLVAKHAQKCLSPGPKSSLTLTTGSVSEKPIAQWSVVGSYATGLQGMVRCLALDLAPIRVNVVSPGAVDTELWKMTAQQKQGFFEELVKKIPVGKVASAEELAEAYLYLMKDRNTTGVMVSSSGGHLLT